MEIIPVTPRGYCKGVVRAINLAKKTALEYPNEMIFMLGMIVHNKYVVEACELLGIQCVEEKGKTRLELLDKIHSGVVIFTAHGISDEVYQKAIEKGLIVVNASCDDVTKTQIIVKEYLEKDYEVLYIGKKFHPEAEAVIAISDHVHFIESKDDINQLPDYPQVMVTNQTTMSIKEIYSIIEACKAKYKHIVILDEICNATRIRQEAIEKLTDTDCLFVVGDPKSNNSNKLKEIALLNGIPHVYLIETSNDIQKNWLEGCDRIAITSGASTPTYLTNQVIEVLKHYSESNELLHLDIDMNHLLD
ncbi:4-hydroxy-3-methylbut-2-enyl diphosphate reductase [Anaerorhabdus sp.]|uniref:4-hydroxy-3-methylbut-2-enyl diphosphate reductase n=1 Tax=Anaerorhabdus sp. TaxID=1872524 RepID=UPI002FC63626